MLRADDLHKQKWALRLSSMLADDAPGGRRVVLCLYWDLGSSVLGRQGDEKDMSAAQETLRPTGSARMTGEAGGGADQLADYRSKKKTPTQFLCMNILDSPRPATQGRLCVALYGLCGVRKIQAHIRPLLPSEDLGTKETKTTRTSEKGDVCKCPLTTLSRPQAAPSVVSCRKHGTPSSRGANATAHEVRLRRKCF